MSYTILNLTQLRKYKRLENRKILAPHGRVASRHVGAVLKLITPTLLIVSIFLIVFFI